jgi:hypothetical protein
MFEPISHDCAKKGFAMLVLLALLVAYGGGRALHAAWSSLRNLPRSNDDLVFW